MDSNMLLNSHNSEKHSMLLDSADSSGYRMGNRVSGDV